MIFQVIIARNDTLMLYRYTPIIIFNIDLMFIIVAIYIYFCHYENIQELFKIYF